jgi:para-aminobenzoate synthetase / 4-amino-4-deoxychorismate lyase
MGKDELETDCAAPRALDSPLADLGFESSGMVPRIRGLVDGVGPAGSEAGVWIFREPTGLIEARNQSELEVACATIDEVSRSCHVVLLIDYEIGSWFEPKLKIAAESHGWAPFQAWVFDDVDWLPNDSFENWLTQALEGKDSENYPSGIAGIRAEISESEYLELVDSALKHIAAGEIYQVNLTWRTDFTHFGSPLALYRKLRRSQPVNQGAYLQFPDRVILSLSPELFLERRGDQVLARPMKGTRARNGGDEAGVATALMQSEKDRAENLMIVDLIRNDLGKIAEIGSVRVDQLFRVEEYPTVFQMVSQVSARISNKSLYRTLKALFPCGSVTGAPKIRAMEIVNTLERSTRGIYTGSVGHMRPGGDFSFNVAIRTIELNSGHHGRMHVGSGIVSDSSPSSEYAECWAKARFLTELKAEFMLFETFLFDSGTLMRVDAHLERLKESARFFGFKYDESTVRKTLFRIVPTIVEDRCRVKLMLSWEGGIEIRVHPLPLLLAQLCCIIAAARTESTDPLLRHKTTARKLYDNTLDRLKTRTAVFDALFFNEQGELTEGARSNVFLVKDGAWFTPPIRSGLLSGVMRTEILATRRVRERKLYHEDLINADAIYLSNSLRGLVRVSLLDAE